MIAKGPLIIEKHNKLPRAVIEEAFGEKLRSLGFVPMKNATEWYAIINGKIFCSLFFNEIMHHDILFRIQPICCRILNSQKAFHVRHSEIIGFCESAVAIWRKSHSSEYEKMLEAIPPASNNEFMQGKVEFFVELFDSVVFPYLKSLNGFSDIVCERDWYIRAVCAYLTADQSEFYNSAAVYRALTNLNYANYEYEEHTEFEKNVRLSAERGDLSILGECLRKREQENISFLKNNIPRLFKSSSAVEPVLTEEFIKHKALQVVNTTYDYSFSIPEDIYIEGVDYKPFPMSSPIYEADAELLHEKAKEIITKNFSELLCEHGFSIINNDVYKWYKSVNDIRYYLVFSVKGGSLSLYLEILSLYDEIYDVIFGEPKLPSSLSSAMHQLGKLVGLPVLYEFFPNALVGNEEVITWLISRIECQLRYIVFPRCELVTTLSDVVKYNGVEIGGTALYLKYKQFADNMDFQEMRKKYGKFALSKGAAYWQQQRYNISQTQDGEKMIYFLEECKRYNLKALNDLEL
ncbi:MAG: hypothetical protein E7595_05220 [Ruminococcaceae bacterium]|nr:hypothetical protein [Oscillospiraceae bacterium]